MPQTTTHQNACSVQIYLEDEEATLQNISGSANSAGLNFGRDMGELMTFEGDWVVRTDCKKRGSVSLAAIWTTAAGEARALMEKWFEDGGRRRVRIDVPNSNPGSRRYEGYARMESYELPLEAGAADPIKVSSTLQTDGAWAFDTIGS